MNKTFAKLGAIALMGLTVIPALAQTDKKAEGPTCPACKMVLSAKKSDKTTVAVQLKKGGKVMYCCAHCKMDPKIVVKTKSKGDTKM